MTSGSDFKKRVRALAEELGITYTEARNRLIAADGATPADPADPADPATQEANQPHQLPDHLREYVRDRAQAIADRKQIPYETALAHLERTFTLGLPDLVADGVLDEDAARFLSAAVKARMNIVIGGLDESGKTTLLRALGRQVEPTDRLCTIEHTPELGLGWAYQPNVIEFSKRGWGSGGGRKVSMDELATRALRQHPGRLILDETTGSEILTVLNGMARGYACLTTIRARNARAVIDSIAACAWFDDEPIPDGPAASKIAAFQGARRADIARMTSHLMGSSLDFIVYVSRDAGGGLPRLEQILEIDGCEDGVVHVSPIFTLGESGHASYSGGISYIRAEQLVPNGWTPPSVGS